MGPKTRENWIDDMHFSVGFTLGRKKKYAARSPFNFTGPDDLDILRNWLALAKSFVMADGMLLNFNH